MGTRSSAAHSALPPGLKVHLWESPLPAFPSSKQWCSMLSSLQTVSCSRKSCPAHWGGPYSLYRSVLMSLCFWPPDSAVSGSKSITLLPLYDKLIRAARHVQRAAPPSWLVPYLPVGGQQPGNRKNPSPMRALQPGLYAVETLWEPPMGYRTPGHCRGTTLIEYFLERAAGLLCLKRSHSAKLVKYLR